jgi:hypothetical protein
LSEGSPFLYLINQQWQAAELNQLQKGALLFTHEQAIKMQQRLSGISETQELVAGRSLGSY